MLCRISASQLLSGRYGIIETNTNRAWAGSFSAFCRRCHLHLDNVKHQSVQHHKIMQKIRKTVTKITTQFQH